jgi:excisionase family DNA binding protein
MIQLEALLPIEDLSKQLGLNKYTIYQKIRKNKFPKGVKLNGRRLFKTTEIEEYL